MKVGNQVLPPTLYNRSPAEKISQPKEESTTANIEALQVQVEDILELGSATPETASRGIGELNEALQSLKQITNSGTNASALSVVQRFQNETLPKQIDELKANQNELQQQIEALPASDPERIKLELQLQVLNSSLDIYQQATSLLANSPLLQEIPGSPQGAKLTPANTAVPGTEDTSDQIVLSTPQSQAAVQVFGKSDALSLSSDNQAQILSKWEKLGDQAAPDYFEDFSSYLNSGNREKAVSNLQESFARYEGGKGMLADYTPSPEETAGTPTADSGFFESRKQKAYVFDVLQSSRYGQLQQGDLLIKTLEHRIPASLIENLSNREVEQVIQKMDSTYIKDPYTFFKNFQADAKYSPDKLSPKNVSGAELVQSLEKYADSYPALQDLRAQGLNLPKVENTQAQNKLEKEQENLAINRFKLSQTEAFTEIAAQDPASAQQLLEKPSGDLIPSIRDLSATGLSDLLTIAEGDIRNLEETISNQGDNGFKMPNEKAISQLKDMDHLSTEQKVNALLLLGNKDLEGYDASRQALTNFLESDAFKNADTATQNEMITQAKANLRKGKPEDVQNDQELRRLILNPTVDDNTLGLDRSEFLKSLSQDPQMQERLPADLKGIGDLLNLSDQQIESMPMDELTPLLANYDKHQEQRSELPKIELPSRLQSQIELRQMHEANPTSVDKTAKEAITELVNQPLDQVTSENFERLHETLATYNASDLEPKPTLSKELVNHLEAVFLKEAAQQKPEEQARLLSMLPGIDANDVRLQQERGSLSDLGQLKTGQGSLSELPQDQQQTLVNQVNQTLQMSGASLRVEGLEDGELKQAVQEIEKQLGLPVTGEVSVNNLREIEKTQRNLYVTMTNARNILHDEILPEGTDKVEGTNIVQELESLVGKEGVINEKEALKNVNVLRDKYFWLTDKDIPDEKLSPELYQDTLRARDEWLNENREVLGQSQTLQSRELDMVRLILEEQGGEASYSQLQEMANDEDNFTLHERAAIRKLVENDNVYDYAWSSQVRDTGKNGKRDGVLDGPLSPPDRANSTLTTEKLNKFDNVIYSDHKQNGGGEEEPRCIHIPEFYDGRKDAAKLFDACKVSGDESLSFLKIGAGTNDPVVKSTLKNAQENRGNLTALKRDLDRLYHIELQDVVEDEFSGGELGENLAYVNSAGEDWIAEQEIGSAQNAELLLAKFKPQIDQIGADNGPIAWAVGHSADDRERQQELLAIYDQAEQSLSEWKANPNDAQAEKDLMALTSKVLIRLQADQSADVHYDIAKDEAVEVTKKVAIVATATVVTVATAGAGAPSLLAAAGAVAAGTAAGTGAAVIGETADQVRTYAEDTIRNKNERELVKQQQQKVGDVDTTDEASKNKIIGELDARLENLETEQTDRKVIDKDKLYNAAYEGCKTSFVTSLSTAGSMGFTQLGGSARVTAVFDKLGKAGNVTRAAMFNGLSGVTGDIAGKIISPIKLNNASSPLEVRDVVDQMEAQVNENKQIVAALEEQKISLQAQVSALNQKFEPIAPQTDNAAGDTISLVQTIKQEPPTEAEIKAIFTAQIQLQEIEQSIGDLTESNQQVEKDIAKIKQNAGSLITWDSAEWDSITENLGRNLTISFFSSATLNMVGGKTMPTRIGANTATSFAETVGLNALSKYVDGNIDQDLFEGVIESALTSLISDEASTVIQNRFDSRQSLDSTVEGHTYQNLQADSSAESKQLLDSLQKSGFIAEDRTTHAPAFERVFNESSDPKARQFMTDKVSKQSEIIFRKGLDNVRQELEQVKTEMPDADLDVTVLKRHQAKQAVKDLEGKIAKLSSELSQKVVTPDLGKKLNDLRTELQKANNSLSSVENAVFDKKGNNLSEPQKTRDKPKPVELEVGNVGTIQDQVSRMDSLAEAREGSISPEQRTGDQIGREKLTFLLNDKSDMLTDTQKTEYLNYVETRLADPANAKKSVHDIMQEVVSDFPEKFTHQGNKIPMEALIGKTIDRAINLESVYGRHMTLESQIDVLCKYGVASAERFALSTQSNPHIFNTGLLDMNSLLSGRNDVGWWSISESQVPLTEGSTAGPSKSMERLIHELALDPEFYTGGAVRFSLTAEQAFAAGLSKPTPLDGVPFKEWVEASANSATGRTAGGAPEGVLSKVPMNNLDLSAMELYTYGNGPVSNIDS